MESGTGAFLADMKVGVTNKGLSASDRISDALHDADQVFACAPLLRLCRCLYSCPLALVFAIISLTRIYCDAHWPEFLEEHAKQQPVIAVQRQPRARAHGPYR